MEPQASGKDFSWGKHFNFKVKGGGSSSDLKNGFTIF